MVTDTNNIISRLGQNGRVVLDIGCGARKLDEASIGVDVLNYPGVDLVGDIYDVLALFPDNTVDGVYSSHFMEHLTDVKPLVDELARVMKPGAEMKIVVPHFSNPYYFSDPTHKTPFGLYTFCYFSKCALFSRKVPTYNNLLNWELVDVRLRFKSPPPFYFRFGFKKIIEWLVNLGAYTQELYEDIFSGMVACYEIEFLLVRQ